MDPASILPAVTGADAVLTAAGPRGTGPTTVITDSVRAIASRMRCSSLARKKIAHTPIAIATAAPAMRSTNFGRFTRAT